MSKRIETSRLKGLAALGVTLLLPVLLITVALALLGSGAAHAAAPPPSGAPAAPAAPFPGGTCVDFEGLTAGAVYTVGQAFVDSAAVVMVGPFEWSSGTVYTGGHAYVDTGQLAGGAGLDINANNVTLHFDFGLPLSGLLFRFGEYGGNLNININGDFRNFDNLIDIHGQTIGGVEVFVLSGGLGNDTGLVRLSGVIAQFAIGGQELWLDDVCPETDCVDFEEQTPGATFPAGAGFVDSGVPVSVEPFEWSNGTVYTGGLATVTQGGQSGGWGLDVNANNVNLAFHFPEPLLKGLVFDFGEYGGNLNISVNGQFHNFQNFADIHGLAIGGTWVKVIGGLGNDTGRVFLFGPVHQFAVGGQELFIDNVCPASCCVEFESLPLTSVYAVGDSFYDPDVLFDVVPFTWSNGTVYTGGHAYVDDAQMSGGTGQDVNTNNVNLAMDFGGTAGNVTLLFGEFGGNVNVEVNGDLRNVQNLAELDNTVVGGVDVFVVNGLGNDRGRLILDGEVHTFAVGGQEFWLDHVCFVRVPFFRVLLPVVFRAYPLPE
jgi:hypothetical protein